MIHCVVDPEMPIATSPLIWSLWEKAGNGEHVCPNRTSHGGRVDNPVVDIPIAPIWPENLNLGAGQILSSHRIHSRQHERDNIMTR
jgi:hypothetical protein